MGERESADARAAGGGEMRIARVFPRKTTATPTDELAFVGSPPMLSMPEVDEVHISVTFTWDLPLAEQLEKEWEALGVPIKMGGPALGSPGGEFVAGRYVKQGMTFTSRGCPNKCWFCSVWRREPKLIELPIVDGYNLCDDNLLSCSESHIRAVFAMLGRQKERSVFTGGLEAKIIKPWHIDLLAGKHIDRMYFAYDTADDLEPLTVTGKWMDEAGISRHKRYCYVLIGYPKDTVEQAESRLREAYAYGFFPFAMLYRNDSGVVDEAWRPFQRMWARPAIARHRLREVER